MMARVEIATRSDRVTGRTPRVTVGSSPSSTKANPSRGGDAKLWALTRPEGGTDKAARLPKGWTGPVRRLGRPGLSRERPGFFYARRARPASSKDHIVTPRAARGRG